MREDLLVLLRRGGERVGGDRVVSQGFATNKSSRSGKKLRGFVMRGLKLRSSMYLG